MRILSLILVGLLFSFCGNGAMASEVQAEYGEVTRYKTGIIFKDPVFLKFKDFSLQFIRTKQIHPLPNSPVRYTYQVFELTEPDGKTSEISGASEAGSLFPKEFKVGDKKFSLYLSAGPDHQWMKSNELVVTAE